ncbi:MAG: NAD-dependent epimerase/dehydratase family protein [Planctomycetota bacterium]
MIPNRRQLLAGTGAALAALPFRAHAASTSARPQDRKRLLILGGTGFLGPHVVAAAQARGWEITLFNRGRSDPGLFPDIETLIGDRDPEKGEGLGPLGDERTWDYVVDTTSYVPRLTRAVCELLRGRVERYALISTVSVYASMAEHGVDEASPVGVMPDPTNEDVRSYYGPLKALCEQAAEEVLPGQVANIRPGLIVGPRDKTDRFTYWPVRVREGGRVLAPGSIDDPVQCIDARDLAEFTVHCLAEGHLGVMNATGPSYGLTIGGLLYGCRAAVASDARFSWCPAETLERLGVQAWTDMPVWTPSEGPSRGHGTVSIAKAMAAGLTSRPLAETVGDTLTWWDGLPEERQTLRWGIDREREQQALAALDGLSQEG